MICSMGKMHKRICLIAGILFLFSAGSSLWAYVEQVPHDLQKYLDDKYIYSAFKEQYNIDLNSIKYLHWWKFKALLKSLKEDTEFVKIKGYRAYEGKDKNMNELKEYWELPKPSNEKERLNALYETLK